MFINSHGHSETGIAEEFYSSHNWDVNYQPSVLLTNVESVSARDGKFLVLPSGWQKSVPYFVVIFLLALNRSKTSLCACSAQRFSPLTLCSSVIQTPSEYERCFSSNSSTGKPLWLKD